MDHPIEDKEGQPEKMGMVQLGDQGQAAHLLTVGAWDER